MLDDKLSNLPALPGVYIFKNAQQEPIYIGKAKVLKKRVGSYFKKSRSDWKVDILVPEIADLEYIITKSETEALLLEAELVRIHQPKFNVLLKDGHPFVYILVDSTLKLVRNKKERGTYFGPFLYKGQARAVYHALMERFNLNICNKKIANGCLQYHLGRCAGACKPDFDNEAYEKRLTIACAILSGKSHEIEDALVQEISGHNTKFEFEKARTLSKLLDDVRAVTAIVRMHFDVKNFDREITGALRPEQLPDTNLGKNLRDLLGLDFEPVSVDCFDISHSQGRMIVGSCVRFVHGVPDKDNYRRFAIKTLVHQDDYRALQEIVARRYKIGSPTLRGSQSTGATNQSDFMLAPQCERGLVPAIPDLILIDGGKGQLRAVQKILPNAHIMSLAKREETVFGTNCPEGVKIDCSSPAGRALIALRDYAHRVAITYHRYKRRKDF